MAATAYDSNGSAAAQWLICRAAQHLCAIPLSGVIETMRALPVEPVSGAPFGVRGLAVIRGAPVPVVDLALVLGGSTSEAARFVTVRAEDRTIALAVDTVEGIRSLDTEECDGLPPLLQDAAPEMIAAIGVRDTALTLFLSTTRIVPPDALARLLAEGAA
jgi:purine-binding chemotaxis protein CheW